MKKNTTFPTVWFFLKQYRAMYAIILFVLLADALFENMTIAVLLPLLQSFLGQTSGLTRGGLFAFIANLIGRLPFGDPVISTCILALVLVAAKEALAFIREVLVSGYSVAKVMSDAKLKVFEKYARSDYQFFLDSKQGALVYNALVATARLGNCLLYIPQLATALLLILSIGIVLMAISVRLTLMLLVVGLVYSVATHVLAKKVSYGMGKEKTEASTDSQVITNEFIDGIKQIRTSGTSNFWLARFRGPVKRLERVFIRNAALVAAPGRVMELMPVVFLVGITLVLRYWSKVSSEGILSNLAVIGVYAFALYRLVPHLTSLGRLRMQIMETLPDVELLHVLLQKKTASIAYGERELRNLEREIRFEGVTFGYKGKKDVLKDVSFAIEKGATAALVGESGVGKSTIVNLLMRLFDPDSGRITIDGTDLKDLTYDTLTRMIAVVSQETFIFNGTVRENIAFGAHDVPPGDVVAAATLAYADEFIRLLPQGYETIVGDKGLKLSGGQRQRIAIARAILRDPQVLILDEATSSLDHNSELIVQSAINNISRDRTTLVIAHRLSTVMSADKIVVLHGGRIVEEGTHGELMGKSSVYKGLYEDQTVGAGREG